LILVEENGGVPQMLEGRKVKAMLGEAILLR
jgi:hypothetical protein